MTPKEWATEFVVVNGRQPSPAEFSEAKEQGFPSLIAQPTSVPPLAQNYQNVQQSTDSTSPVGQTKKHLTPLSIFYRVVLVIVIAVFGYIVGYLFA